MFLVKSGSNWAFAAMQEMQSCLQRFGSTSSHLEVFHLLLGLPVTLQRCVELSFKRIHGAVQRRLTGQREHHCTLTCFSLLIQFHIYIY